MEHHRLAPNIVGIPRQAGTFTMTQVASPRLVGYLPIHRRELCYRCAHRRRVGALHRVVHVGQGALLPMQSTRSLCRRVPGPSRAYEHCGPSTDRQRSQINDTGLYWLWCDTVTRFDAARWQLAAGDTPRQWWVYLCRSFPASAILLELPWPVQSAPPHRVFDVARRNC